MIDSYLTVDGQFENTIIIERSKFICSIKGVNSEEEAKQFVAQVKKQHSLATHNCYAYIADEKGLVQKFSDDGEPQGTAGMPILEVLRAKKLFKTVAVVTRYFGGVKLGAGGLVRAYSSCVSACADFSKIVNYVPTIFYQVISDYENYSKILNLTAKKGYAITKTDFGDIISLEVAVFFENEKDFINNLSDIFRGNFTCKKLEESYYNFG